VPRPRAACHETVQQRAAAALVVRDDAGGQPTRPRRAARAPRGRRAQTPNLSRGGGLAPGWEPCASRARRRHDGRRLHRWPCWRVTLVRDLGGSHHRLLQTRAHVIEARSWTHAARDVLIGHEEGASMARLMTVCQDRFENPTLEGCLARHTIVWPYPRRWSVIVPSRMSGICLRRANWTSVRYAAGLHASKRSTTLQRTDRPDLSGQQSASFPLSL
jgi:hypothetical protein